MEQGKIVKVSGPLVLAEGLTNSKIYDLVRVGETKLMGEIIEIKSGLVSVQVYEETAGLGPGDPVESTGNPLSVELGPGVLSSIYDGVQRPLDILQDQSGAFITRGISAPSIDRKKKWDFVPKVKKGEEIAEGDILGTVQETTIIEHRIMVPHGIKGKIKDINKGKYTVEETVAKIDTDQGTKEINMITKWPVRKPRPYIKKDIPDKPLITGQRVIDTFFPIAQGGTACVPGPFGSGKTVIQHQFAKWANAEIIIFIGCGERGNEMTDVLLEFPKLIDPTTGENLMKRTVLIANTSNMPVAAREASIYTGITIAEYYRDMGYNVALQADSTSRWAEALREISGRLEEMPGEEGFPAYLGTRLASFYERSGKVNALGNRDGSITVIGSVSPPGGDLSEPVVQNTLRVVKVFWALEDKLAYQRHFPAINWMVSYSLYLDNMKQYWKDEINKDFPALRDNAMKILQRESELSEIVRLVGIDALSESERILMNTAKSIREDFLQQHAFHEIDTYSSLNKQLSMLQNIMAFNEQANEALKTGMELDKILSLPVKEKIARSKYLPEEEIEKIKSIRKEIDKELTVKGATNA